MQLLHQSVGIKVLSDFWMKYARRAGFNVSETNEYFQTLSKGLHRMFNKKENKNKQKHPQQGKLG